MRTDEVKMRDEDSEKLVLGTIISGRNAIEDVRDLLTVDSFYNQFHAQIFEAILQIEDSGGRADLVMVKNKLTANGVKFNLTDYMNIVSCHTFDLRQYACRLHDLTIRRKFWYIGQYLITNSCNEAEDIVDVSNKARDDLTDLFKSSTGEISTLNEGLENVYEIIKKNLSTEHQLTGTPTGFEKFDERSGGLQKSDLIIIAGESSQGKTSLLVSIMRNAALSGSKVAMYSMEMKKEQISARMISMESGVPSNEILYSRLSGSQIQAIDAGIGKIWDKEIYFDDRSTSNIDTIISSIRFMKLKYDIDGAAVDYLQILNVNMKGANKEQQMGDVARRLKNLAKDLDIWIIALSQLNRNALSPVPSLSRLRDSGQIAEAADIVLLVYRPEVYGKSYPDEFEHLDTRGTAMVDIAKGRNIGIGKFICGFNALTTMFYNLDSVPTSTSPPNVEEENPF